MAMGGGPSPSKPPQASAFNYNVSSGAFKIVHLTKEQLKEVALRKQSKFDPIVL